MFPRHSFAHVPLLCLCCPRSSPVCNLRLYLLPLSLFYPDVVFLFACSSVLVLLLLLLQVTTFFHPFSFCLFVLVSILSVHMCRSCIYVYLVVTMSYIADFYHIRDYSCVIHAVYFFFTLFVGVCVFIYVKTFFR